MYILMWPSLNKRCWNQTSLYSRNFSIAKILCNVCSILFKYFISMTELVDGNLTVKFSSEKGTGINNITEVLFHLRNYFDFNTSDNFAILKIFQSHILNGMFLIYENQSISIKFILFAMSKRESNLKRSCFGIKHLIF